MNLVAIVDVIADMVLTLPVFSPTVRSVVVDRVLPNRREYSLLRVPFLAR